MLRMIKSVFCCVDEVTFGKHLKVGLVARRPNQVIRGLELLVPNPDLQGGGRGWRFNSSANTQ